MYIDRYEDYFRCNGVFEQLGQNRRLNNAKGDGGNVVTHRTR